MKIGFVGLGKMGFNMVLNLSSNNIEVIAYDIKKEAVDKIEKYGIKVAFSIEELMQKLPEQKIIWLMIPAGKLVDSVIEELLPYIKKEDIIIDGGNSFYKDSIRRHDFLKTRKIDFIDVGTSGGLKGARHGACLTIGCDKEIFKKIEPICKAISSKDGYAYVGSAGAGHFVKMVHNGIEYVMIQAYGDGFELLFKGPYQNLDLKKIAETWQNGSVIRSWLLELAVDTFNKDPELGKIEGIVGGGETGQWAIETAKEFKVPFESVKLAMKLRKKNKKNSTFSGKVVAALRNEFGGHKVVRN